MFALAKSQKVMLLKRKEPLIDREAIEAEARMAVEAEVQPPRAGWGWWLVGERNTDPPAAPSPLPPQVRAQLEEEMAVRMAAVAEAEAALGDGSGGGSNHGSPHGTPKRRRKKSNKKKNVKTWVAE